MFNITNEIKKLKRDNIDYNTAIDDVLEIFEKVKKKCSIVHTKSGLYFNGYENNFQKGKNTLSKSFVKKYFIYGRTDIEILENAFEGHTIIKENGEKYIHNIIVYQNSEISKILSKFYSDLNYLPISDFKILHEN